MENSPGYKREPFYYETDKMNIIHHSNYIRWFEEARVDLLKYLGMPFEKMEAEKILCPVLSVEAKYLDMVRFGDHVLIKTTVTKYTGTRLDLAYEVIKEETGNVCTTGSSSHCFMDWETNRLIKLSKTHPHFDKAFKTCLTN